MARAPPRSQSITMVSSSTLLQLAAGFYLLGLLNGELNFTPFASWNRLQDLSEQPSIPNRFVNDGNPRSNHLHRPSINSVRQDRILDLATVKWNAQLPRNEPIELPFPRCPILVGFSKKLLRWIMKELCMTFMRSLAQMLYSSRMLAWPLSLQRQNHTDDASVVQQWRLPTSSHRSRASLLAWHTRTFQSQPTHNLSTPVFLCR